MPMSRFIEHQIARFQRKGRAVKLDGTLPLQSEQSAPAVRELLGETEFRRMQSQPDHQVRKMR